MLSPLTQTCIKKKLLQSKFNNLSTEQTERPFLKKRQAYYEHSNKVGKLLSHQLRQISASHMITEICTTQGMMSTHPVTINE